MSKPLAHDIIEATRLTQAGRLREATALLQRHLRGSSDRPSTDAPPPVLVTDSSEFPHVIDGTAEEVPHPGAGSEEAASQAKRSEEDARPQPPQRPTLMDSIRKLSAGLGQDQSGLTGLRRGAPAPSEVFPSNGAFLTDSFSNHAGSRPYKLYVPSCRQGEPRPLIVMLHGCTQSPDDFAAGTRMNFAAEEHGCFVAYPEQIATANSSRCWNWFQTGDQTRDQGEPSLIAGIVSRVMSEHRIDCGRIYIAGLSAGGAAAAVLAEAYPDVFAALGVHSGLACGAARDLPSAFAAMQGRSAGATASQPALGSRIPTIVFHGDRDATVHPSNGAAIVDRAATGESYRHEIERDSVAGGRSYTRTVHRDASGKELIEEWLIHGGGHAWSGGSKSGSFTDPLGPDATREMLRFFLSQERAR